MKISLALATLLTASSLAHAAPSVTLPVPVAAPILTAPEVDSTDDGDQADLVIMAYALHNYADQALDIATSTSQLAAVKGTPAASFLSDLIEDTKGLKNSALRVALLLEDPMGEDQLANELSVLAAKYSAAYRGSNTVMVQLQSQGQARDAYFLRTAYTKIRSRYVYLQGLLAE